MDEPAEGLPTIPSSHVKALPRTRSKSTPPSASSSSENQNIETVENFLENWLESSVVQTSAIRSTCRPEKAAMTFGELFHAATTLGRVFLFHIALVIQTTLIDHTKANSQKEDFIETLIVSLTDKCAKVTCRDKVGMTLESYDDVDPIRIEFPQGMNFFPEMIAELAKVPEEYCQAVHTCIGIIYSSYRNTVVDAFFKEYVFSITNFTTSEPVSTIVNAFADFMEEKCQLMERDLTTMIDEKLKHCGHDSGLLIRPQAVRQKRKSFNHLNSRNGKKIRTNLASSSADEEYRDDDPNMIAPAIPPPSNWVSSRNTHTVRPKSNPTVKPRPKPKPVSVDSDLESNSEDIGDTDKAMNGNILAKAIDELFAQVKYWNGTMCVAVRLLLKHCSHKNIKRELKRGAGPIIHRLIDSYRTGIKISSEEAAEMGKKLEFKDACTVMFAICWKDDYLAKLKINGERRNIHAAFLTATADIAASMKALVDDCPKHQAESIPLYSEEGIRDNNFYPLLAWSPTENDKLYKGHHGLKTPKEMREAMSVLAKSIFIGLCTKMNFSGNFHKRLKETVPSAKALHGLNDTLGLEHAFSRNEPLPIVKSDANPRTAIVPAPKANKARESLNSPARTPAKSPIKKGRTSAPVDYSQILKDFINAEKGVECDLQAYGAGGLRAVIRLSTKENIFIPLDRFKKDEKLSEEDLVLIKLVSEKSHPYTKDGKLKGGKVLIRKKDKGSNWFEFQFPFSEKGGALWVQSILKDHFTN